MAKRFLFHDYQFFTFDEFLSRENFFFAKFMKEGMRVPNRFSIGNYGVKILKLQTADNLLC